MKKITRQSIIDTAANLFYLNGYNSTGINQLIEEAGIVKSTLYQHFKSKEEIAVAYLTQSDDMFFKLLEDYLGDETKPEKRLLKIFLFLKEVSDQDNWSGCRFLNVISETPEDSAIARAVYLHKKRLNQLFIDEASDLTENQSLIGTSLFLIFEGALVDTKVFNNAEPAADAVDAARFLLNNQSV